MARIRSIHPGFAKSEDIAGPTGLSKLCRLHFAMLWTYCDDEGRGKDSLPLLKAELWPLDDDVTTKKVEAWMVELAAQGRITRYCVDGRRYFQVENWQAWQHPQKKRPSTVPPPPDDRSPTVALPYEDDTAPVGLSPVVVEVEVEGREAAGRRKPAAAPPPAEALLRGWYESRSPKPVLAKNAWPGMRRVVQKALDNGNTPEVVRSALRNCDVVSAGWLEPQLRKAATAAAPVSYDAPKVIYR